ncbi:SsrA-binding protein SmpB [Haloglycomyces albus]|uniref:SsrA-binding protein SmpB n=1 Tax=Haloglycomyces albus TaxID=526067 RepID=UPI00046C959C|nr:SsrA-binding protein SmpB [Haloglycomyces albus]
MSKKKKSTDNGLKHAGPGRSVITTNRKARYDYDILDTYEAGLVLSGTEVKALRQGRGNLNDAFGEIHNGEARIHNLHIQEYDYGTWTNHPPRRIRKLLLHRSEIDKLQPKLAEVGLTLIPLSLYFNDGWAKVELGLARGRKRHDKRQALAKREADREIERALGRAAKRGG